jgi:hypothetical protein
MEPLFNQWYAWTYLIPPASSPMYVAFSHFLRVCYGAGAVVHFLDDRSVPKRFSPDCGFQQAGRRV